MTNFEEMLAVNPIVGAIRNDEGLNNMLKSNIKIVFVLYGDVLNIQSISSELKERGKIVFIHIDMIDGLKGDQKGVEFIYKTVNPHGIISTKGMAIKYASQFGMYTIQRIFILDSLSVETSIKNVHTFSPDAVEVLPGIACKAIKEMKKKIRQPIIAGGLIKEKKDIQEAISSGAVAVSTSSAELWDINKLSLSRQDTCKMTLL